MHGLLASVLAVVEQKTGYQAALRFVTLWAFRKLWPDGGAGRLVDRGVATSRERHCPSRN